MVNVLMIGASRDVRGGISSVVNGYYEAGLANRCNLNYIGTAVDGNKVKKALYAIRSFICFKKALPQCDVVHVHMASRNSYERKKHFIHAAKKGGKAYIIHMHGGQWNLYFEDECTEAKRDEIRQVFSDAAKVFVLSEEWREYFALNVCDDSKVETLHNAIKVPPESVFSPESKNILFLGRLDTCKSPDILLLAFSMISNKYPDVRLVFGGDGYIDRYKEVANNLSISEKCDFLGWVTGEEKERLFDCAEVYCLPSKNEGMPMSVLEAMAHGIPTVATSVGGIPQVIDNGINGFLMPVDDTDSLVSLLDKLLSNRELRKNISAAGRNKIAKCFSLDAGINQLIEIYERISK